MALISFSLPSQCCFTFFCLFLVPFLAYARPLCQRPSAKRLRDVINDNDRVPGDASNLFRTFSELFRHRISPHLRRQTNVESAPRGTQARLARQLFFDSAAGLSSAESPRTTFVPARNAWPRFMFVRRGKKKTRPEETRSKSGVFELGHTWLPGLRSKHAIRRSRSYTAPLASRAVRVDAGGRRELSFIPQFPSRRCIIKMRHVPTYAVKDPIKLNFFLSQRFESS